MVVSLYTCLIDDTVRNNVNRQTNNSEIKPMSDNASVPNEFAEVLKAYLARKAASHKSSTGRPLKVREFLKYDWGDEGINVYRKLQRAKGYSRFPKADFEALMDRYRPDDQTLQQLEKLFLLHTQQSLKFDARKSKNLGRNGVEPRDVKEYLPRILINYGLDSHTLRDRETFAEAIFIAIENDGFQLGGKGALRTALLIDKALSSRQLTLEYFGDLPHAIQLTYRAAVARQAGWFAKSIGCQRSFAYFLQIAKTLAEKSIPECAFAFNALNYHHHTTYLCASPGQRLTLAKRTIAAAFECAQYITKLDHANFRQHVITAYVRGGATEATPIKELGNTTLGTQIKIIKGLLESVSAFHDLAGLYMTAAEASINAHKASLALRYLQAAESIDRTRIRTPSQLQANIDLHASRVRYLETGSHDTSKLQSAYDLFERLNDISGMTYCRQIMPSLPNQQKGPL